MAGFDKKVEKIGPVRSARKPLVQIAVGFDIPFAHCGGSEDSFEIIRAHKTKSLDEIYSAGECFWRSNDRSAPDNLYTSITKIEQGASRRGFASFHPEFYATGELQGTPALGVSYAFSNSSKYPNLVEYRYDCLLYTSKGSGQDVMDTRKPIGSRWAFIKYELWLSFPNGYAFARYII